MKITRKVLLWLAPLLAAALLTAGALWLYAGQQTVPRGVKVGGLPLGGKTFKEAENLLAQKTAMLLSDEVLLRADNLSIESSFSQIGAEIYFDSFTDALRPLQKGSLWSKIKHRWQFRKSWTLEADWQSGVLKEKLNASWEEQQFGSLKNAERIIDASDHLRYVPEVTAPRIDWDVLSSRIHASLPRSFRDEEVPGHQTVIELPLITGQPPVTVQSLKAQGITRRISIVTTALQGASGRIHNVEAAAKVINGMLLAPGDVFDYGKIVEKAGKLYGFREAPVIVQGRLVPGVGGGICQVSGTLYGAVIRAGLEIVERRNHSRPVSYLPKGQDATFSTGYINFKFKNNTDTYIYIRAQADGGRVTVKLFGTLPRNLHYEIYSRTVKTLNPAVRYISNPMLPRGTSRVLQAGSPGSVVETYRIKWVDGHKAGEELLSRDTYPSQPSLIAVRSAAASPGDELLPKQPVIVEDGVKESDTPH